MSTSVKHGADDKLLFILFGVLTTILLIAIVIVSVKYVKRRRIQEHEHGILEQRIDILRQQRTTLAAMESGRITCHPHLSADQIKALPRHIVADKTEQPNAQQTCGICLVDYRAGDQVIDLPCKHFFHESCVVPWLSIKDKCPYCNYKLCSPQEP